MKTDLPYYRRQGLHSPGTLVSGIRFMWRCDGVLWRRNVKWEVGIVDNSDFRFFRLPTLRSLQRQIRPKLHVLLLACHWHRNRWPCLTLNYHFTLYSVCGPVCLEPVCNMTFRDGSMKINTQMCIHYSTVKFTADTCRPSVCVSVFISRTLDRFWRALCGYSRGSLEREHHTGVRCFILSNASWYTFARRRRWRDWFVW